MNNLKTLDRLVHFMKLHVNSSSDHDKRLYHEEIILLMRKLHSDDKTKPLWKAMLELLTDVGIAKK